MALCDITNVSLRPLMRPGASMASCGCPAGDSSAMAMVVSDLAMCRGSSTGSTAGNLTFCGTAASAAPQLSQRGPGAGMCPTAATAPWARDGSDSEMEVGDPSDPQEVSEYAVDIYEKLRQEEVFWQTRPDYMEWQPDVNAKMRAILIDWLVEVHMKYKLKIETLFLAVNITDRFLERRQVKRKRLQLVGVTGMMIAAKYEEIYPPEVREFVYITDRAYTKEEILAQEMSMLSVLEFRVCCPTPANFLDRYQRVDRCSEMHRHLIQYILELSLLELRMNRYPPSHLVAAACMLSNKLLKQKPSWPPAMVKQTKMSEQMIRDCAKDMCGLLENAGHGQLQAVQKKFMQPAFHSVASMTF